MNDNPNQTLPLWQKIASFPLIEGMFIGAVVRCSITPGIKWTNQILHGKKVSFLDVLRNKPMAGALAQAVSAAPAYATTFSIKDRLEKPADQTTQSYELCTSFIAGSISGFASTPFDVLVQSKHIEEKKEKHEKHLSAMEIAKKMIKHHGYRSFFQGAMSTSLREGLWSTIYLTAIPMLSKHFQGQGLQRIQADFFSVLIIAGAYGVGSGPLNQFRFKKQEGLTDATPRQSYLQHAKTILSHHPNASDAVRLGSFFKGSAQRVPTMMVAAAELSIFRELCKSFKNSQESDVAVPSQTPK